MSALDQFCAVTLGVDPGCIALSQVPGTSWLFIELAIIHLFFSFKSNRVFFFQFSKKKKKG